jgi:hypothetical protein
MTEPRSLLARLDRAAGRLGASLIGLGVLCVLALPLARWS